MGIILEKDFVSQNLIKNALLQEYLLDNNLQIAHIKEKKKLIKVIAYSFQEERMANFLLVNLKLQEEKECV